MKDEVLKGFSALSKNEKLEMAAGWVSDRVAFLSDVGSLQLHDGEMTEKLGEISENAISLYPLPYSVAPNFLLNGKMYHLPMVTEESSVVAAAASGARFWAQRGGFHAKVPGTRKPGQVHFTWKGPVVELNSVMGDFEKYLRENLHHLTSRMEARGGGITGMEILDMSGIADNYYQLKLWFETGDSMGANFINSCLEEAGKLLELYLEMKYPGRNEDFELIMAILSNYTPECFVEVQCECAYDDLEGIAEGFSGRAFAEKFKKAVDISLLDTYRAVTHNKGIFNGIDAFMLATGNDFRAVEANGHAYAARDGQYRGLSWASLSTDRFVFGLRLPMSVGTIGGLTRIHPLAGWSFDMLGNPGATELMMLAAAAGLASNFSAIRALITKGIQYGHMKMHLGNILSGLGASDGEKIATLEHFRDKKVSYSEVKRFLDLKRQGL